ncbi:YHYH protein [Meridianimarinicoccus aquatilis]|uniref:YHYH protein n=1 Tax=Meridianimarinicoccus aquatilis TaxID=2552766 RepID=A0A4R6B5M1_9RHOB|nr:YHYH protein [Fluviibacterium aquatile]TDL90953.1 YHYH protein [Fluviibacterium aquatile]
MPRPMITAMLLASTATMAAAHSESPIDQLSHFFESANVISGPEIVDCTLSEGAQTTCFSITVSTTVAPKNSTPGPWRPTNISDGPEAGGIWLQDGEVYDVDGAFISKLAEFYGDAEWQLFDPETGEIQYTGTLEACEAAARPDVDPAYQNHCVQCQIAYVADGSAITYVIPLDPVASERPTQTNQTGSGVAFNGVRLDGPAPVNAILGAYTIAPFDDCGGHVNTHVGYHYHAVTDCLDGAADADSGDGHGGQIGIAMDGYPILPHTDASGAAFTDLDSCNGHKDETGAYHYHAGAAGSNQILGCLSAQAGCVLEGHGNTCDASARPPRP